VVLLRTANAVVGHVCGLAGFSNCCDQQSGKGWWKLSCVQAGAAYAKNTLNAGDVCGRYAWAQGPIAGTQQYYPRDFSLLALSGKASGFQDVQGPVAANGDVASATGFNLNSGKQEPIALVSTGGVNLASGTVNGDVNYVAGNTYQGPYVTYFNGAPSAVASPGPIPFSTAYGNLQAMSNAIAAYGGIPASKSHQTITFTAAPGEKELSVFSVAPGLLTGTTSFIFAVPTMTSAIIVNVLDTNPIFQAAGFGGTNGPLSSSKILWNFPNAKTLVISSLVFPGSILAPNAAARLADGQIDGTVVVNSADPAAIELHWAPYQVPSSGGCLWYDAKWSCSDDTAVDDAGHAAAVAAEAGFLQIDSESYSFLDAEAIPQRSFNRTSPTHRIWYSFWPAATTPASKPLAVFFNGGPGGATSSGLFSFNTAPWTLDPDMTGGKQIASNPNSWTQFANLLYIDAPGTGFSYPIRTDTGGTPSIGLDIYREAATVLQVVIRFLDRHPFLQCNQVMLVGESFGGTRASMMLNHVLNYQQLNQQLASGNIYQDLALYGDLQSHFDVCGSVGTAQFGSQVLIEPLLAGGLQTVTNNKLPTDVTGCAAGGGDVFQCNQVDPPVPPNDPNIPVHQVWYWEKILTAATNLTHPTTLLQALGVTPWTIAWLLPSARNGAYSHGGADEMYFIVSTPDMNSAFGTLPQGDSYFVADNATAAASLSNGDGTGARTDADLLFGTYFLNAVLSNVKTFITHADHDNAIDVLAIPRAFLDTTTRYNPVSPYPALVSSFTIDNTLPSGPGIPRPGQMKIVYKATNTSRSIRFPEYADAGHSVAQRMPAALLADVIQWYNAN
jgi:choice-of-anchor A domain-containing protein